MPRATAGFGGHVALGLALALALGGCGSSGAAEAGGTSGGQGGEGAGAATAAGTGAGGAAGGGGAGGGAACEPSYSGSTVHLAVGATLAPGNQENLCLRWTTPKALDITGYVGTLGPTGHHSLLLARTGSKDPDGVAPCDEASLMDAETEGGFELLAGVSYETSGKATAFPSVPLQIGLHVAAGTQLIFDAHLLNSSAAPAAGCATLDLSRGKPVFVPLEFRTVLPTAEYSLTVPAHGTVSVTYAQPSGGLYRIAAASSHMHAGGTHFRLSIKETGETVYETTEWAEPTPQTYESKLVTIAASQSFQLDCSFANTTGADIHFPQQMCVGGMYLLSCALPGACM